MIVTCPTHSDTIVPSHGPRTALRSPEERHKTAVANTFCWAQEAAAHEAFDDALEWLRTVEVVDGPLSADWQRTRASWRLLVAQQR